MNKLIKIIENHSQGYRCTDDQCWCYISDETRTTLCGDDIDSDNIIKAESKTVKRGGITCPLCLDIIKRIKAIKL